ncbi:phage baseplate assembly protein V [uncultured Methylobacterium sp.]|mgnify:CR=1 FL=1|jgi:phage baseplate assembly protein V|uniref:phage baseplate assembly protein V n=1 Tax=uncultured Methylobacterium sp. TaxID=157278 RepID=UPI002609CD32|nr:phage baseplate assembly protein V [uncultured Methylobacterium sp.]
MSDLADLLAVVQAQARQIAALEDRVAKLIRVGPVTDSEHGKGVRVDLGGGEDGKPNKSTWLQNADATGATSVRPRVGDQVVVLSPNGDQEQGVVHPFDHSDERKNPAPDGETSVLWKRDGVTHTVRDGVCTIEAKTIVLKSGGVSYTLDENHTFKGGKVKHDDKNIGKDHVHPGIERGPSKTDPPDP